MRSGIGLLSILITLAVPSFGSVTTYGDEDCLNQDCYGMSDPTAGATLQGLPANSITLAATSFGHSFPFSPNVSDFPSLVGSGQTVTSITPGIAADDFQFPEFGNPYTATIDSTVNTTLSTQLDALNETGPEIQFFTIGLSPTTTPSITAPDPSLLPLFLTAMVVCLVLATRRHWRHK